MKRAFTYRIEAGSNWKIILDGQNELHHLPMLHRRLVGKDFVSNAQGNIRYRDVRLYRYHGFHAMDFPSHRTLTPLRLPVSCRKFPLESSFSPIFAWFPVPRAV